ncbi:MAG: sensor histidine kinase [Bacteroidota bacterium]
MTPNKPYKQILRFLTEILVLVLVGNILTLFTIPRDAWSIRVVLTNCAFSVGIGWPAWKVMGYTIMLLDRKIPWLAHPVKRLIIQFIALTIVAGIVMFMGFAVWIWLIEGLSFSDISKHLLPTVKVAYIFMFLSLLVGNSILFFKKWQESVRQQEELKRAHLALQYQSLREQVRPHFLFNSLSSLVTLINTDPKKATLFVHKLSDVYRYVLEQRENELVPVSDEVQFLEDYVYLQKIRFGESLQVHIKLKLDKKKMMIPLSLQMMVENAIKHNEVSAEHPLLIDIFSTGAGDVVICNTLQKKAVIEKSPGMGIENLRKQIAFFTQKPLLIEEGSGAFTVTIPTITS